MLLLKSYQRDVRLDIARKRGLWNEAQMVEVPRDDGGPRLMVFKPHARIEGIRHDTGEPFVTAMDANGFCNVPGATPKTDIIALGDSFTVCTGTRTAESWVHLLGRMTGRPAYNLGRGGIGPYDYLQILIRFGIAMRPDIVIMNIYEGNDLRDSLRYRKFVEAAAAGRPIVADAADRGVGEKAGVVLDNPLGRRSYAINLVVAGFDEAVKATGKGFKRALGRTSAPINFRYRFDFAGQQVPFNLENTDLSEVKHARALKEGRISTEAFTGALERFVALAHEHGFRPVVSYSPSAYTAYAEFVVFEDPDLADLMPWYSRTLRAFLAEKGEELGYTFVDQTPALQAAARRLQATELLYFPINVHFTAAGNRVVAEALAAALAAP